MRTVSGKMPTALLLLLCVCVCVCVCVCLRAIFAGYVHRNGLIDFSFPNDTQPNKAKKKKERRVALHLKLHGPNKLQRTGANWTGPVQR